MDTLAPPRPECNRRLSSAEIDAAKLALHQLLSPAPALRIEDPSADELRQRRAGREALDALHASAAERAANAARHGADRYVTAVVPAAGSVRRKGTTGFGRGELCNRAACRRYALAIADKTGRGRVVTHVGATVYSDCERLVREHLAGLVHHHPSGFRTLEAK